MTKYIFGLIFLMVACSERGPLGDNDGLALKDPNTTVEEVTPTETNGDTNEDTETGGDSDTNEETVDTDTDDTGSGGDLDGSDDDSTDTDSEVDSDDECNDDGNVDNDDPEDEDSDDDQGEDTNEDTTGGGVETYIPRDCGDKVLLCHLPVGREEKRLELCIDENAVEAHLTKHSDWLGGCQD